MTRPRLFMHRVCCYILLFFLLCSLGTSPADAAEVLDLNKATISELQKLPFIGEARAKAIFEQRNRVGEFTNLEQLLQSPAIGPATLEAIRPHISVGTESPALPSAGRSLEYAFKPQVVTKPGEIMLLPDKTYYHTLLNFIQYAEQRIDITMFLYKSSRSPKNRPALIAKALIAARKRGVAVNVLLENSGYDEQVNEENARTAALLRKNGITVRFDSSKTTTHAKLVVIDERFCFLGSHNFTQSALQYNNEISLLADSPAMAQELLGYIDGIR